VPSAIWKFCDADRGLGSIVVSQVTDDEPEAWPRVWSARLDARSTPRPEISLANQVDGYTVKTYEGWPLRPDITYAITRADDSEGFSVLGNVLEFQTSELNEEEVLDLQAGDDDLARWLGPDGPACQ
jgi:hypothetical protein